MDSFLDAMNDAKAEGFSLNTLIELVQGDFKHTVRNDNWVEYSNRSSDLEIFMSDIKDHPLVDITEIGKTVPVRSANKKLWLKFELAINYRRQ